MRRITFKDLVSINSYWFSLSFMWTSLHVLILPAVLLVFVSDERKNTILGLMSFAGLIIAMLVQPISGAISDRLQMRFGKRRPWIFAGTLLDLIFLTILAMAGGLPALTCGYIGLQLTSNIAHGPAQGLMHDKIPLQKMGMASGIKNLFDMSGLVVASLVLGRIFTAQDQWGAYGLIMGILLLGAGITVFGVRESPAKEIEPQPSLRSLFHVDIGSHRDYWQLIFSRLLFLIGVYGVQAFAQYFVQDTLQAENPVKLTGDLLAVIVLALIGFSLLAGYLSDRIGRKPIHWIASGLVAVGCLLIATARSETTVLIFGSIIGAGIGLFLSANWALANDLAPAGEAGKFLGLTNLATAGSAALSRLFGPMIDAVNYLRPGEYLGYTVLFLSAAILSLVSLLALRKVPEKREIALE